ncbi:hypothetical protein EGW08_002777, partial [Elysia chlorotica]
LPALLCVKQGPTVDGHWHWDLSFSGRVSRDVGAELGWQAPAIGLHAAVVLLDVGPHLFVLLPALPLALLLGLLRQAVFFFKVYSISGVATWYLLSTLKSHHLLLTLTVLACYQSKLKSTLHYLQAPDAGLVLLILQLVGMLLGGADHLGPADSLLQFHEPLLVLVALHQDPRHLHTREPLALSHRDVVL